MVANNNFLTLLHCQQDLNNLITPDWHEETQRWHVAYWVKLTNLLDHLGWKWWSPSPVTSRQETINHLAGLLRIGLTMELLKGQPLELTADQLAYDWDNRIPSSNYKITIEHATVHCLINRHWGPSILFSICATFDINLEDLTEAYLASYGQSITKRQS